MSETFATWRTMIADAPVVSPERLIGPGGLVVIAPHPDDETIGAAALLVGAHDSGGAVALAALTDGEGSHRKSRTHPPEHLAALRRAEQESAVAILSPSATLIRLGLPDGSSLHDPAFDTAVAKVEALCRLIGASALATTMPRDNHPDHDAAWHLATRVQACRPILRLLAFPVWSVRTEDHADAATEVTGFVPFRLPSPRAQKAAALRCHQSQLGGVINDDPDGFALPAWFIDHHSKAHEPVFWARRPGTPPGAEHFSALYADDGDPWGARSLRYEVDKRAFVASVLDGRRFASMLEIGCGEGHLTAQLADCCDRALGIDIDPAIVARARHRHDKPHLSFAAARLPSGFPERTFDLFILSEVLYFFDEFDIETLAGTISDTAADGSTTVLVNYLGDTDAPLTGDDAADLFIAFASARDWSVVSGARQPGYRCDVLSRASLAQATP